MIAGSAEPSNNGLYLAVRTQRAMHTELHTVTTNFLAAHLLIPPSKEAYPPMNPLPFFYGNVPIMTGNLSVKKTKH